MSLLSQISFTFFDRCRGAVARLYVSLHHLSLFPFCNWSQVDSATRSVSLGGKGNLRNSGDEAGKEDAYTKRVNLFIFLSHQMSRLHFQQSGQDQCFRRAHEQGWSQLMCSMSAGCHSCEREPILLPRGATFRIYSGC